jgi:hypothetical protein
MIAAKTITMSKFGPSGSSIRKNTAREDMIDSIAKMIIEIFFDVKFI